MARFAEPRQRGVIGGAIGGTTMGSAFGGLNAVSNGQDFFTGAWSGAKMGFVTGSIGGLGAGVKYSMDNNVNLFNGKPNPVMERPVLPKPLPTPKVGVSVSEPSGLNQTGTNSVYEGIDPNTQEVKYVGITQRSPEVRWDEHYNSNTLKANLEFRTVEGATGLTRIDARIYEQTLINRYGLDNLYNKINSISPKYWNIYNIKH